MFLIRDQDTGKTPISKPFLISFNSKISFLSLFSFSFQVWSMTSDKLIKLIHSLRQTTKNTSINSRDDIKTHGRAGGTLKKKITSRCSNLLDKTTFKL